MNEIIILDKPAGITSHDCCDEARKILDVEKAGHAGTLDIGVTGVLVIALGEATKLLRLFSGLPKEYQGMGYLHEDVSREKLEHIINDKFLGKIKQIPPKRSRVKREEREREIFHFKILGKEGKKFSFSVLCEAGTYIRKLIHDLGQEIGINAHMVSLRRIKQGPFTEKEAITFEKLKKGKENVLLNLLEAVNRLQIKVIKIDDQQEQDLRKGKFLNIETRENEFMIAVNKEKVVALVQSKDNLLKPERVLN